MRRATVGHFLVAMAGALTLTLTAIAVLAPSADAARKPTKHGVATAIGYVAPVDASGHPAPGYTVSSVVVGQCQQGSLVVTGAPVFRCTAAGVTYDPCWAVTVSVPTRTALCLEEPWSTSAVEVHTGVLAYAGSPNQTDLATPWGVQLTNGMLCLAVQGTHASYEGQAIDFDCTATNLHLLRGINRSATPWTARSTRFVDASYTRGPTVKIKAAWYAGPK